VHNRIKITAFGEARLRYPGNPTIIKGIHIGEVDLRKPDGIPIPGEGFSNFRINDHGNL